jgi:hypothetical protein
MATATTSTKGNKGNKGAADKGAPVQAPAPVASAAILVGSKENPVTGKDIAAFVTKQAGGNYHNVFIVPLDNVQIGNAVPVPFGYAGKPGGVRATIQDSMLYGVPNPKAGEQGQPSHLFSLADILPPASKLGHSAKNPVCLLALLNGGYSTSAYTWGTPYVKLVAGDKAPAHPAYSKK